SPYTNINSATKMQAKGVIVNYAKEFRRNNAAAYFKLNENMVRRWVRASKKWTDNVSRNSKRVSSR
ncbi:6963_t:CDS:2, partial [Funneliformis geosporum]